MWVKICGNTRAEDALLAAELRADALGFIFAAGSRRLVSAAQVRGISEALAARYAHAERVGVFTEGDAEGIARVFAAAKLTALQLHGGVAQAAAPALRKLLPGVRMYAAFAWSGDANFEVMAAQCVGAEALFDGVLVDAPGAGQLGGTGQRFDWAEAQGAFARARAMGVPAIAAGGLDAGNAAGVVRVLQPWGVDVASGTESVPGVKDAAKLRAFLAAALA